MNTVFTIGQAANIVGRSIKTLRRYESAGLITPQRIGSYAHRMYTEADIVKLRTLVSANDEAIRTGASLANRRKKLEAMASG